MASPAESEARAGSWEIRFARRTVTVDTDSDWLGERIPRLYGTHCQPCRHPGAADFSFSSRSPGFTALRLVVRRGLGRPSLQPPQALTLLHERLQSALVEDETHDLMLHAAGVERDGHGVLFAAGSGAGKTTLAAWLAGHGYRLLSDELIAVDESNHAAGFCQALNVKTPGIPLVVPWDWLADGIRESMATPRGLLVPWLGAVPNANARVRLIVFPHYEPGAALAAEPLGPVRAMADLLRCLLNARNFPQGGLRRVAGLCRQVPATRLRYSRLEDVIGWLDTVLHAGNLPGEGSGARCP